MEDVLDLYAEPPDETRPVVCMDELSKELHGQAAEAIPAAPGRPAKEDYEYKRHGTGNVFLLLCPLLGWRHLEVTERRGYREFAQLMKGLRGCPLSEGGDDPGGVGQPEHPRVRGVVRGVHAGGARRIARRLEFHYTPKHGSWLNMAEMEFGVLSRQCLDRRIATAQELADAIAAWERERNEARTKIEWTFRIADARRKLHWIYPS